MGKGWFFWSTILIGLIWVNPAFANPSNLTVWIHGTTISAVLPTKLSGKVAGEVKMIHFEDLYPNSEAFKKALALEQGDKDRFSTANFYLCNWSGFLSHKERILVAEKLYDFLIKKVQEVVSQTGQAPQITIIAHSHGGNIALSLARYNQQNMTNLQIDRLVLLACPVQACTANLVSDKIFKKVYAFYSYFDPIQVLDMQWFAKLSGRKFAPSDNMSHIQTHWKYCGLFHNDFKTVWFVQFLPELLSKIDAGVLPRLNGVVGEEYLLNL